MRLLLISANGRQLDDGRRWSETRRQYAYAPTTLTTLAALVPPELEAEVFVIDEAVDPVPADFCGADLVAISAMTCDAPRAYRLAARARTRQIPVVIGGYHATFMPEEAGGHADAVVKGFAEVAWPQLLRDFARGSLHRIYAADWAEAFRLRLPRARRDLLNRRAYTIPNSVETSRGCPNHCSFCIVAPMHERRCLQRRLEDVAAEVAGLPPGPVALLDANPGEDRAFAAGLFAALKPLGRTWFAAASLRCVQDVTWVKAARASGCRGLVIGFESLEPRSLAAAGKSFNEVGRYREICRILHNEGIAILGCFIFGFDGETPAVFERTVEFVSENCLDLALYSVYSPFPGTAAWIRLSGEGRILTTDWSRYDGRQVVFRPVGMTVEELQAGFAFAWEQTYRVGAILRRVTGAATLPVFDLAANLGFRHYRRTFLAAEVIA